jgi:hypothetical protein
MPVCGDQSAGPVQLKCPDFVSIPDVQVFQVPGQGPIDLTFNFVFAEAAVPNELDVFQLDDQNGRIGSLSPAEPGYLAAALARAQTIFPSGSDAAAPNKTLRFNGGGLALFRYQNRCGTTLGHTGNTFGYTQFAAATADGSRSTTVSISPQRTQNAVGCRSRSSRRCGRPRNAPCARRLRVRPGRGTTR